MEYFIFILIIPGISLQSVIRPGFYVRLMSTGMLGIASSDGSQEFNVAASFNPRMGWSSTENSFAISFESIARPGYYLIQGMNKTHLS